jgi:L-malate glycosyltransferase
MGLKILFIINTPLVGGAERHTFDLSRSLNEIGFDSSVFAMKRGVVDHYDGGRLIQPSRAMGLRERIDELRQELEAEKYDLVVGVNERPIVAAFFARRASGIKPRIVGILHSTILRNWREELLQIVHFPLFRRIDSVIFISENQRRRWLQRGMAPSRHTTILNGVDVVRYSPRERDALTEEARGRLGVGPEVYLIGLSAVFRPEKNHLQMVDAIAQLRREGVNAAALFIGDGPMRGAIEARVSALNLGDAVLMPGMIQDVRPYIAATDVGVNCSVSIETVSLSALEILAMGVPMVMSEIGGASEIIDGENGLLFPAGDDDALLAALRHFSSGATRTAAGTAAREKIEERFDHRSMVAAYANYFQTFRTPGRGALDALTG